MARIPQQNNDKKPAAFNSSQTAMAAWKSIQQFYQGFYCRSVEINNFVAQGRREPVPMHFNRKELVEISVEPKDLKEYDNLIHRFIGTNNEQDT